MFLSLRYSPLWRTVEGTTKLYVRIVRQARVRNLDALEPEGKGLCQFCVIGLLADDLADARLTNIL
jgi:hypothetical protein